MARAEEGGPGPPELAERSRDLQFKRLPITADHGVCTGRLPWHHRDPFDRVLSAQAQLEDLTLITRNTWIPKYDVSVLRA
ncbi:type II toxin-antitoxin system VapC family toxin [Streptomyces sp. NPDC004542]|uniref:type II toxin-antitoxin system VapC family toxin n=1 Tax=Streptomyces sp. NPDC004542 TaxID=3154281 RepID=UPI0033A177FD